MEYKDVSINKKNPPRDLLQALEKFEQDGDPHYLLVFIKKNGVQNVSYDLDNYTRKITQEFVECGVSKMERTMDYDSVFKKWKILIDAGLLTQEILKNGIKKEIKIIKSPEDLLKKIKNNLGWEIKL